MEIEYRLTGNTLEITGMDLTQWRHKNSVYLGSFYVKEITEQQGKITVEFVSGDTTLVNYRDSIHEMHVGWKTPLVELLSSFMKVAYLISRGVVYQPFEDPENFIYNKTSHRIQMAGRYDTTLNYIDEEFLDWVMEVIGFLISKETTEEFGYLTHQEYYNNMDADHKELYKGYLQQRDFESLIEYTLEPSVIEVLDDYTPISRIPINNKPTIRAVLEKSVGDKEKMLKEEALKKESLHQQESELTDANDEDIDYDEQLKKRKQLKKSNKTKKRKRRGRDDKINEYRKQLGIPEDKEERTYKRKGANVIPMIFSLLLLAFSIWIAWSFFTWLM